MPSIIEYHCLNCGNDFSTEVLTKEEAQKARDKGEHLSSVRCPRCGRADLVQRKAA